MKTELVIRSVTLRDGKQFKIEPGVDLSEVD